MNTLLGNAVYCSAASENLDLYARKQGGKGNISAKIIGGQDPSTAVTLTDIIIIRHHTEGQ